MPPAAAASRRVPAASRSIPPEKEDEDANPPPAKDATNEEILAAVNQIKAWLTVKNPQTGQLVDSQGQFVTIAGRLAKLGKEQETQVPACQPAPPTPHTRPAPDGSRT